VLLGIVAFAFAVTSIAEGRSAPLPHTVSEHDLRGAAVYSSFCVDSDTGDVNGMRVFVRRPDQTPRILVQYAEGSLSVPEGATVSGSSGRLLFAVPDELDAGDLRGEVRGDHVTIRREGSGARPFRIDRVTWPNAAPYCGG